jgi:hypothetical protein
MKYAIVFTRPFLPITLIGTLSASADPWLLQSPTEQSLNRFSASFRMAFQVDVEFKNLGAFTAPPGRLTLDGDAYNYDDGYVLEDSTQNAGGFTRYWGYDSASQVPGDGTLLMSHYSSTGATAHDDDEDEFQSGGEITYSRVLGGDYNWRWGLETALNYMYLSARDSSAVSASVTRQSDAYPLPPLEGGGFVDPPPAPHYGRYASQPGDPALGAAPVETRTSPVMATVTGTRRFEADVFGLRFGPFLEVPLGGDLFLAISGGLAMAHVRSDFEFNDTTEIVNGVTAAGSGSHQDLQVGTYAAGNLIYRLGKPWELFGGVQYQDVGKYSHKENGSKAVLDLSHSLFVVVGVNVSF